MQVLVPAHPPLFQPVKTDPFAGVAVNVTAVLLAYEEAQAVPQLIPVGVEVTVPVPDPSLMTVNVNNGVDVEVIGVDVAVIGVDVEVRGVDVAVIGVDVEVIGVDVAVIGVDVEVIGVDVEVRVNAAVTDLAVSIVTVQDVLVPVQASDQPSKTDPASGVAVNVTEVLLAYEAEQVAPVVPAALVVPVAPQLIPAGVEVTVPDPVPDLATVSVGAGKTAEVSVMTITEFTPFLIVISDCPL